MFTFTGAGSFPALLSNLFSTCPYLPVSPCLSAERPPQGHSENALSHVQPGGDPHQHTGLSHVYMVGILAADTEIERDGGWARGGGYTVREGGRKRERVFKLRR